MSDVSATLHLTETEPSMTVADLIARLQRLNQNAVVKIFDADTRQFEPVTGMVYGGDEDIVELHSDDIS